MAEAAARWRPIGAVLVEGGSITQDQLDAALAEQQRSGRRLGEILIDSGAITWLALANAIAEQAQDLHERAPVLQPVTADNHPGAAPVLQPQLFGEQDQGEDARLQTVEAMLKDRQRAFLELVSTTESLRRTVVRLRDDVADRDGEIRRLRAQLGRA